MRRQLILLVSVGLNVILALLFLSGRFRSAPVLTPVTNAQAAGTNKAHTEVVLRKQFFSWREVESADYPAYIANLRGIGCPEQTVRDIIIADVNQLYGKKRAEEVDTPEEQWWHAQPDTNFLAAAKAKKESLELERRTLLTTLLGTNWDIPYPETTRQMVALNGPLLGDLAPETKDTIQKIVARSKDRMKTYLEAQEKVGKSPDAAEMARMEKQARAELTQALNPAQLEEFLLRYSQTALNLRTQMQGFEATPDEFRAIFKARDQVEQQMPVIQGDATAVASQQRTLEKQEEDAIKNALGPKRYQEYLVTQDPAFRDAVALGQQSGASPETVQRLYALNKAVLQEQDQIRNDATLTAEEKQARLASLDQQQQSVSDQLLGLPPPAPPLPPAPVNSIAAIHPYSPGETVDMIAARYGVSAGSILSANPDVNFNQLPKGAQIKIPKLQQ